ncbi:MAG TPA: nucleotidyltransferase [Balneolaceae bacterium]
MKAEHFTADVQEFLALLHEFKVKYLIIGGEAVIYYGNVRITGDIDIYYKNNERNIEALYDLLLEFWNGDIPGIKGRDDLRQPNYMIQFGVPPNRIDLLNDIEGVNFEEAWNAKMTEEISIDNKEVPVYFIGLRHLIINKERAGRNKDREDLKYLRKLE